MNTDAKIEKEIQAKGLTAPRITEEVIDSKIKEIQYHVFPDTTTTVCCLTLRNGFTVVGKSACASPENFNQEVGRKIAFLDARRQVGDFLGYQLRETLHKGSAALGG